MWLALIALVLLILLVTAIVPTIALVVAAILWSDALGSDRLVIRPLKQTLVSSPIGRLLFPERHQPVDRDAPNIFIVDKGREHDVIARLRLALLDFCVFSVLYLGTSLWLVQAAWPWLA